MAVLASSQFVGAFLVSPLCFLPHPSPPFPLAFLLARLKKNMPQTNIDTLSSLSPSPVLGRGRHKRAVCSLISTDGGLQTLWAREVRGVTQVTKRGIIRMLRNSRC